MAISSRWAIRSCHGNRGSKAALNSGLQDANAFALARKQSCRHPSERWKRFSTAGWLVIHLDPAFAGAASASSLAQSAGEDRGGVPLLFVSSFNFKVQKLRASRESLFFERQRKVTKRKPPCVAPGVEPPGPQAGREFLEAASCCSKNGAHPCAPPLRGLPDPLAASHGT